MAGIYIHIPFCKKACHYCNFHFSTSTALRDQMIAAICKEIEKRKDYLSTKHLNSIYFGGGTPSLLTSENLSQIFERLAKIYTWTESTEITLEANPDDITKENLIIWTQNGINRLSIGIQSFFNEDLIWMNRAHDKAQAINCIELARSQGINQISADLIYGLPSSSMSRWQKNVEQLLSFSPDHISSYCLTVEPSTALAHFVEIGKIQLVPDEASAKQFLWASEKLRLNGFDHYEISNFARSDRQAIHNTSYWRKEEYMGIGPSAHSYDGKSRQWNISNNPKYINFLEKNQAYFTKEELSNIDHYNEYIMTGFRTKWGVDTQNIADLGKTFLSHFEFEFENSDWHLNLEKDGSRCRLSHDAWLYADRIASDFFILNESF